MIGLSFLVLLGPCLIMAMAALALAVVNLGVSRADHARVWAIGCGLSALHWGLLAAQEASGQASLQGGLAGGLLGTGAVILLAEGFRMRRWPRRGRTALLLSGAAGLLALIATAQASALPIHAAITPLISLVLLLWSAGTVMRAPAPSATEFTVATVLIGVVLIHLGGVVLAVGEQFGFVQDRRFYAALYMIAVGPTSAAIALAALMLIAYDYAAELRRLLHTDPLTGILNRQGFDTVAAQAFGRARPRRMALALADIDYFKQVNDRYGHGAGDAALASVAERLATALGRDGTVGRIGGEEFAILLPGLDGAAALARVELLRQRLRPVGSDDPVPAATVSFGVAERVPGETLTELMERADAALYQSKREGRDRCTLAPAAPETP